MTSSLEGTGALGLSPCHAHRGTAWLASDFNYTAASPQESDSEIERKVEKRIQQIRDLQGHLIETGRRLNCALAAP
jgi:hypothetical protein